MIESAGVCLWCWATRSDKIQEKREKGGVEIEQARKREERARVSARVRAIEDGVFPPPTKQQQRGGLPERGRAAPRDRRAAERVWAAPWSQRPVSSSVSRFSVFSPPIN
jgi:hypothetical protein